MLGAALENDAVVVVFVIFLVVVGVGVQVRAVRDGLVQLLGGGWGGGVFGGRGDDGEVYGVEVVVVAAPVGELELEPDGLGWAALGTDLLDGVDGDGRVGDRGACLSLAAEDCEGSATCQSVFGVREVEDGSYSELTKTVTGCSTSSSVSPFALLCSAAGESAGKSAKTPH